LKPINLRFNFIMMPLLLYINLDRDAARRDRIEKQLLQYEGAAQRLPACFWRDLPPVERSRFYSSTLNNDTYYKPLQDGEKGCYVSHIRAWEQLLESNHEMLVVLEDDVVLLPQFSAIVGAITQLNEPWDMVKLIGREREKARSQIQLTAGTRLVTYSRVPSMTSGYVISRSGAAKLLAHRLPFGRPVDVDLRFWWECGDLRILGVTPSVIGLDITSADSSIWTVRDNATLKQRWRKLKMKWALTVGSWKHPLTVNH
jgi:glycosyl transferase, family 25